MDSDDEASFQFWEYRVSHGCLLVRSPRTPSRVENIDIEFYAVEFVQLPRHLGSVRLCDPTPLELAHVQDQLGREIRDPTKLWVLSDGTRRHLVAAAGMRTTRNSLDIFESPYDSQ